MPTQRRKQKLWLVITAAVLLTATPSFALFGIGDIVFDPTSYASLIQQLTTLQPASGQPAYSCLSLERFRNAAKFHDRPAAADIAFCVAAISLRMPDDAIAAALDTNYLSSDPNPSRRAAYIRRTMTKASAWAKR